MKITFEVNTADLTAEEGNFLYCLLTGSAAVAIEVVASACNQDGSPLETPAAPDQTSVVTADPKPKRKRRTKAQIAADNAAAEAPVEAVQPSPVVTPDSPVVRPEVVEVDPLSDAPDVTNSAPSEDEVKEQVVAAVGRLTADGDAAPTATVVAVLEAATGKKRVGEISPDQYHVVISALLEVGTAF
jgi:hypothetical protein